jgi:hypothetical protein
MKKLYYARQVTDVMFVSDKEGRALKKEADSFIQEETHNVVNGRLVINEVTMASEVPDSWRDAIVWGQDDDELNPIQYLKQIAKKNDPEYKEYIRLKKKFDGVEEE